MALVAAYFLVLQSLMGALATGASADPVRLDIFGNVICSAQGAENGSHDGENGGSHHLPDCCLSGCSLFGAIGLPGSEAAGIRIRFFRPVQPATTRNLTPRVPDRRGVPANPRAPPLTA